MEILVDYNHLIIEDTFNIISLYKVKYNLKSNLTDKIYKLLKSAIKLDKVFENNRSIFIEEIEKENIINSSSEQLELVSKSLKNAIENQIKYFNFKDIQVL